MVILHDFNLGLNHFTLPEELKVGIRSLGFKIVDIEKASNEEKNECIIYFGNRIKSEDFKYLPGLKYIHLGCVGYNNLNVDELKEKKIILSNSSDLVEDAMSEMVLAAILRFNKRIYEMNEIDKISRVHYDKFYSKLRLLPQTKILVYGHGLVGKKTAALLKRFTDHVTVVKRNVSECTPEYVINTSSALKVVYEYDYIVNCLPLNESTTNYFSKDYFELMNPEAVYISVGRSGTTKMDDLISVISREGIRGTYLDVYDEGDLEKLNPITNSKILLTPHISGWHNEYWKNQEVLCLKNFLKFSQRKYSEIDNLITL